jgi:four helix bundle protein
MAGFNSHRDFAAWQLAYELRLKVMPVLRRILQAKDYKLHKNMREAARSAPRNIAEGFGRFKHKEFAYFVRISKGSEQEMLEHLLEAHTEGYINNKELTALAQLTRKAIKAATGLVRYLESSPDPEWPLTVPRAACRVHPALSTGTRHKAPGTRHLAPGT